MDSIDKAIGQIESLTRVLKKGNSKQVQSQEQRSLIKATALSWFNDIRPELKFDNSILHAVDQCYKYLLEACEKGTKRDLYLAELKSLRSELIRVRSENILYYSSGTIKNTPSDT